MRLAHTRIPFPYGARTGSKPIVIPGSFAMGRRADGAGLTFRT